MRNSGVSRAAAPLKLMILVEGAVHRAFGRRTVVPDDVVDQGVVEDVQLAQALDQSADVVVGVFQEPGVHLHLPAQDGLERLRHVGPTRDLLVPGRQLAVLRDHAELLLPSEDLVSQSIPSLVELALVLVGPLPGHVVRSMAGAGREVDEEGLVGQQRFLLADPADGLVGHVGHEVVAFLRRLVHFNRGGALVQRGVPLVGLSADESVEILETAAAGGPGVEGARRAGLPHRHLVALAELGRGVAVQLEGLGDRRAGVGQDRAVAWGTSGDLGDACPCRPSGDSVR